MHFMGQNAKDGGLRFHIFALNENVRVSSAHNDERRKGSDVVMKALTLPHKILSHSPGAKFIDLPFMVFSL